MTRRRGSGSTSDILLNSPLLSQPFKSLQLNLIATRCVLPSQSANHVCSEFFDNPSTVLPNSLTLKSLQLNLIVTCCVLPSQFARRVCSEFLGSPSSMLPGCGLLNILPRYLWTFDDSGQELQLPIINAHLAKPIMYSPRAATLSFPLICQLILTGGGLTGLTCQSRRI